jgi:hypothetical protein
MRRTTILAMVTSLVACAGAKDKEGANRPEAPVEAPSASASAGPIVARGKLAPPPTSLLLGQFWPTSVCTRGPGTIVVASNCVCDSQMTCSATRRGGAALDLHVRMNQEICKDCGTFRATCAVPPGTPRKVRITMDGKALLDGLELPRTDASGPVVERCYE